MQNLVSQSQMHRFTDLSLVNILNDNIQGSYIQSNKIRCFQINATPCFGCVVEIHESAYMLIL